VNPDRWVLLHPPDALLGYSVNHLRTLLGPNWPAFVDFMGTRAFMSEESRPGQYRPIVHLDEVFRFVRTLPDGPAEAEPPVPERRAGAGASKPAAPEAIRGILVRATFAPRAASAAALRLGRELVLVLSR
jgi:hypothetical protein